MLGEREEVRASLSLLAAVSCHVRFVLLSIAVILRNIKSFLEIQYMQDSINSVGRNSVEKFFQCLYSTSTASFTGLYVKYCVKSSYTAVYSLMKLIAVPCYQ